MTVGKRAQLLDSSGLEASVSYYMGTSTGLFPTKKLASHRVSKRDQESTHDGNHRVIPPHPAGGIPSPLLYSVVSSGSQSPTLVKCGCECQVLRVTEGHWGAGTARETEVGSDGISFKQDCHALIIEIF